MGHDEDRIAEWVQQIECPGTPWFVTWRPQDDDFGAPFPVVRIGIIHFDRDAGVPTVAIHRAVQREDDGSTLEAKQTSLAVLGRFERDSKPQVVHVEVLCNGEVIGGQDGDRSLQEGLQVSSMGARADQTCD